MKVWHVITCFACKKRADFAVASSEKRWAYPFTVIAFSTECVIIRLNSSVRQMEVSRHE